jgi:hypothetical protein
MRVEYTLPALQPWTAPDTPELNEQGEVSFRQLIQGEAAVAVPSVNEQLGLEARPFTGTYMGPPPRPRTLEVQHAESERHRWHSMIRRHSETGGMTTRFGGRGQPVHNMLEMLREMQQMEDAIVSQTVALTRG